MSPGTSPALAAAAAEAPIPFLPGVATPSEAMALRALGFRALKLFPAEAVGGARLLASLYAPLPDLVFCPTGGIDAAKAPTYLALPNVLCVGGSWMLPKAALEAGDYAQVESAREGRGGAEGGALTAPRLSFAASSRRRSMFKSLYDRLIALAASPHAPYALAAVAFAESSVFPIPPDVLLAPMALAQPRRAWTFALICTVASVLGGIVGYAIGALLFDTLGQWLIHVYGYADRIDVAEGGLRQMGRADHPAQGPDADPVQARHHRLAGCSATISRCSWRCRS